MNDLAEWWTPKDRSGDLSDELLAALSVPRGMFESHTGGTYLGELSIRVGRVMVCEQFPTSRIVEEMLEDQFAMRLYEFQELTSTMNEESAGSEIIARIGEEAILHAVDPTMQNDACPKFSVGSMSLETMLCSLSELLG